MTDARVWTITADKGWLTIEDERSLTCVEARLLEVFGTTLDGFVVMTSTDRLYFEAEAQHARDCVLQLRYLLTNR